MKLLLYEDWINSASKKDQVSPQVEAKVRHEVYSFAREMEKYLKNRDHPNFQHYFQKALSIFHRFSHQVSFRNFDRYIYIVASLFLSAKDQDMFNWSLDKYVECFLQCCANRHDIKYNFQSHVYPVELPKQINLQQISPEQKKTYSDKICDAEGQILKMLGYDLDIIVPQVYFTETKKRLKLLQGDSEKFWTTAQNYLADLFVTNIALYYEPKIICMAALQLSQNYLNVQIEDPNDRCWYQTFDREQEENKTTLDDIMAISKYFNESIKLIKY